MAEWTAAGCRTYIEYVAYLEGQELVPPPSLALNEPASSASSVLPPSAVFSQSQSSLSVQLRQNRVQEHELLVRHEYQHQHLHHHYHHVPPTATNMNISITVSTSAGLARSNVSNDAGFETPASPASKTGKKRGNGNSKSSKAKRAKMSATGFRTIELPGPPFRLEIHEKDLREPPPLAPYSDNIERLFEEWYDCGLLIIRNVRVPVSCWAEVYRGSPWYEGKRKFWAECKVRKKRTRRRLREKND